MSLTPEQASFLLNVGISSFRNEHPVTRRVIEAIPLDKSDYRPDDIAKSAIDLSWHIVNTERMFLDANRRRRFRPDSFQETRGNPELGGPQ
jgi:uncharacterized damage-inducible protein DinB